MTLDGGPTSSGIRLPGDASRRRARPLRPTPAPPKAPRPKALSGSRRPPPPGRSPRPGGCSRPVRVGAGSAPACASGPTRPAGTAAPVWNRESGARGNAAAPEPPPRDGAFRDGFARTGCVEAGRSGAARGAGPAPPSTNQQTPGPAAVSTREPAGSPSPGRGRRGGAGAPHVWLCSHRTMLPSFWKTSCPANVTLRGYCSWTWMPRHCSSSSTMSVPSASRLSAGIRASRAKSTYFRSSCSVLRCECLDFLGPP